MNSPLDSLTVWPAGSAPLIARLCDAIDLAGVIDRMVRWDPKQCRTSPGNLIKGLTINVLSGRKALYKVQEYFAEQDLRVLFGQDIEEDAFNDDALGRALDKLAAAGPKKVYSSVAFSAITKEKVIFNSVHADTTSKNVYGNYEGSEQNEETLNITYGYSKDHRPDLKQIMFGLITNNEGISCYGEIMDGNTSDKTWNQEVLKKFKEIIPDKGKNSVYIADSALITADNLTIIKSQGIKFISRLPETFGIAREIKEWA